MVGNHVFEQFKPEIRHLGENHAFLRNRGGHDDIKRGQTIRRDNQHVLVINRVNIPHFAFCN